jgi:hypothetical protein
MISRAGWSIKGVWERLAFPSSIFFEILNRFRSVESFILFHFRGISHGPATITFVNGTSTQVEFRFGVIEGDCVISLANDLRGIHLDR